MASSAGSSRESPLRAALLARPGGGVSSRGWTQRNNLIQIERSSGRKIPMFEASLLESLAGGTIAVLAWMLLAAIIVVLGCAAFTEFAQGSNAARCVEALGRLVSSRLHS
jgi:hypothetical protein